MQPNYFFSSPHYYNVHNASSMPMSQNWAGDASFSTPVSAALYNTTATASWAHTVPTYMPWVTESGNSKAEQIMRFTAPFPPDPCTSATATSWELFNNLGASKTNANLHLKRRSDFEDTDISHKQYITEEKMTARMQELHISNQYTLPPSATTCPNSFTNANQKPIDKAKSITTLQQLEAMFQKDSRDNTCKGSLVLSPEIRNLVEPEKLFAKALVTQVDRPTMAVVLWKPPHGSVSEITSGYSQQPTSRQSCNDSENNFVSSSSSITEANNNSSIISDAIHKASLQVRGSSSSVSSSSSSLPVYPLMSPCPEDADCIMEA